MIVIEEHTDAHWKSDSVNNQAVYKYHRMLDRISTLWDLSIEHGVYYFGDDGSYYPGLENIYYSEGLSSSEYEIAFQYDEYEQWCKSVKADEKSIINELMTEFVY